MDCDVYCRSERAALMRFLHCVLCEVETELLYLHTIDERGSWVGRSPIPHRGGSVLNPGYSMWVLWWKL